MIPPVRSNALDYEAPRASDPARNWPEFAPDFTADADRMPSAMFWLLALGGAALGFFAVCAIAWMVLS